MPAIAPGEFAGRESVPASMRRRAAGKSNVIVVYLSDKEVRVRCTSGRVELFDKVELQLSACCTRSCPRLSQ